MPLSNILTARTESSVSTCCTLLLIESVFCIAFLSFCVSSDQVLLFDGDCRWHVDGIECWHLHEHRHKLHRCVSAQLAFQFSKADLLQLRLNKLKFNQIHMSNHFHLRNISWVRGFCHLFSDPWLDLCDYLLYKKVYTSVSYLFREQPWQRKLFHVTHIIPHPFALSFNLGLFSFPSFIFFIFHFPNIFAAKSCAEVRGVMSHRYTYRAYATNGADAGESSMTEEISLVTRSSRVNTARLKSWTCSFYVCDEATNSRDMWFVRHSLPHSFFRI